MADESQLKILRRGVAAWNEWRRKEGDHVVDLIRADLRGADLRATNLSAANLGAADLLGANLSAAGSGWNCPRTC